MESSIDISKVSEDTSKLKMKFNLHGQQLTRHIELIYLNY